MEHSGVIRDFIYLDLDKMSSLVSQIGGGMVDEIQTTVENVETIKGAIGTNLGILKSGVDLSLDKKSLDIETKRLHHHVFEILVAGLEEKNFLIDLNSHCKDVSDNVKKLHKKIQPFSFMCCQGWATFEDFDRLAKISKNFSKIAEFIGMSSVADTPEGQALLVKLESAKEKVIVAKSNAEKQQENQNLAKSQLTLSKAAKNVIGSTSDWFMEGLEEFLDLLMPHSLVFRIMPFENNPVFQVVASLRRDCFVDNDLQNVMYAYGRNPNVPLSMVGTITSMPPESGTPPIFQNSLESGKANDQSDVQQFQNAFLSCFIAFDGMTEFFDFFGYPNIVIHPGAIYRVIRPAG